MGNWRRIYLHVVWGTKHREPILVPRRERVVFGTCVVQANRLDCEVLAIGAFDDHLHALVSLHPTTTPSGLVRAMKSASSVMANREADEIDRFVWQRGYAALSVSPDEVADVSEYVRSQRRRHEARLIVPRWEPPLVAVDDDRVTATLFDRDH